MSLTSNVALPPMGTISKASCPILKQELQFHQNVRNALKYLFQERHANSGTLELLVAKMLRLSVASNIAELIR